MEGGTSLFHAPDTLPHMPIHVHVHCLPSHPHTFTLSQVLQENSSVELPGVMLESAVCGEKVAETVLAVTPGVRTNFGTQCTLVLTTFR